VLWSGELQGFVVHERNSAYSTWYNIIGAVSTEFFIQRRWICPCSKFVCLCAKQTHFAAGKGGGSRTVSTGFCGHRIWVGKAYIYEVWRPKELVSGYKARGPERRNILYGT
jgi:hypothetical protein